MDFLKVCFFNILTIMLCYLLLVEGAEWYYIHKYAKENLTISCNLYNGQNMSICWYNASSEIKQSCGVSSLMVPEHGGIFECRKKEMEYTPCSSQCNNNKTCDSCSTFIIPSVPDQETHNNQKSQIISTNENVNLSCTFNRSNLYFISFWVAVYPNRGNYCLSSLEYDSYKLHDNTYCHTIFSVVQNRICFLNLTEPTENIQKQYLQIRTAKPSDSGIYLCFYFTWSFGKLKWKLGSNISLEVKDSTQGQNIFIGAGLAGGIIIISVLILMFVCIHKSKSEFLMKKPFFSLKRLNESSNVSHNSSFLEKKMKQQRISNPDTADLPIDYECMPYAISERKDMRENTDSAYSVVTNPKEEPEDDYSEVDITPTGADLCVAYAVVNVKQNENQ